ncbi:MAG: hypothetical protein RR255_00065 [Bacilli bacterium]
MEEEKECLFNAALILDIILDNNLSGEQVFNLRANCPRKPEKRPISYIAGRTYKSP